MFRVFFLCTGNLVRSAMAEAFLRRHGASLPVEISSAGTIDTGAAPPPVEAIDAARSYGVDLSSHRSRPLSVVSLSDENLVLGFERRHTAVAILEAGAPPERTFSLTEFVQLVEDLEPPVTADVVERAEDVVARADRLRADRGLLLGRDLEDPYGGPRKGYERTAAELAELCLRLANALFGERRS